MNSQALRMTLSLHRSVRSASKGHGMRVFSVFARMSGSLVDRQLMNTLRVKLERNLGWIVLVLLLGGCILILLPFMSALLWAIVLCFSSWPIYLRLLRTVGNRRTVAALLMSVGLIMIILLPFMIVGATLADSMKELTAATQHWADFGPPAPPGWLSKIPIVGAAAAEFWRSFGDDTASVLQGIRRVAQPISAWLVSVGFALLNGLFAMAMSIFIAFFLFRDGEAAAHRLTAAAERVGGEAGRHLLTVAANTVRGVVYGILGTALVQALLLGIGLLVARVPGAAVLALLTFFLSPLPIGPPLVWIPAAIWLFHEGRPGWGIFMLAWGFLVSSVDNFVKPWLISKGSDMPFLLIFFGVLGGAMTFGLIGIFLGPTLLAVGYRLIMEWAADRTPQVETLPAAGEM
jgi:predicted PurR-regulated permease PerM